MVRQRRPLKESQSPNMTTPAVSTPGVADEQQPLLPREKSGGSAAWSQWIVMAVASGCCAAFNGVFAKLTTTELTSNLASHVALLLGLSEHRNIVELVVRCLFFGLNLTFNGIMWSLYTSALAKGNSTTQVSIMNTSTNFVVTALLGVLIFSEALPPLWWAGAAMLVAGNVILGRESGPSQETEAKDGEDEQAPLLSGHRNGESI